MFYDPQATTVKVEITEERWRSILLRAADYFEDHPWCQGDLRDDNGAVCMFGAIRIVAGTSTPEVDEIMACTKLDKTLDCVPAYPPIPGAVIVKWNDVRGRTVMQVKQKLREAARQ